MLIRVTASECVIQDPKMKLGNREKCTKLKWWSGKNLKERSYFRFDLMQFTNTKLCGIYTRICLCIRLVSSYDAVTSCLIGAKHLTNTTLSILFSVITGLTVRQGVTNSKGWPAARALQPHFLPSIFYSEYIYPFGTYL